MDEYGKRLEDQETLERVRALTIPPAWQDVWICADPFGHLQATGVDAAGRKQYLYHTRWREQRDRQKFERMLQFGESLPKLRRRVKADLHDDQLSKQRVLAGAVRLLDVGMFRVGSEEYADDDGGVGLATIERGHVRVQRGAIRFDYPAKGGVRRVQVIDDAMTHDLVCALKRRRGGGQQLLAYRDGRRWHPIRSTDINDYLKDALGPEFSAKDFRTWNGTVMAAVLLAGESRPGNSKTARKRTIDRAVRGVAELLGNTPAVARRSYIDPRVFDRYVSGWTIAGALQQSAELDVADDRVRNRVEKAVVDLLTENTESSAVERAAA